MKVYTLPPNEDWIVDRMCNEFITHNQSFVATNPGDADVLWLLADWAWNKIPLDILQKKKVITTCHHYVPSKFGLNERNDFLIRDSITDEYHCFNERTKDFISKLTNKPINIIPYWINLDYWKRPEGEYRSVKLNARRSLSIPEDAYIISSFQRDTEGKDLISPKLEKGPDLFCDAVEQLYSTHQYKNLHVLLGGWRRQYIINRLNKAKIPYIYKELPSLDIIKQMYIASDLYIVSARFEGGPQSLLEAPALQVPTISRPVGIAEQILAKRSIHDDVTKALPNIEAAYKNVLKLDMNVIFPQYVELFERITK